ncbi:cation transporter [bacterium]|nr:cation transporter [bacterium]
MMNTKRTFIFVLLALLTIGVVACGGKEKTTDSKKSQPQMMAAHSSDQSHAMVKLPTVQCGMCEDTIENGLAKVNGIVSVDVDIEEKMGHINYDPAKIDLASIENAIVALGYQANETAANPGAYSELPNCCKLPEDQN